MSETATTATPDAAPAAASGPEWMASLPDDMRADASLARFKDVGGLAKSYRELERFTGADKASLLKLPKDEAAPEWSDVWAKLGRPEKPEGYTFEGLEDMPGLDGFRQAAHTAGLPAKQAQVLAKWYAEHTGQQREALRTEAETTLKQEWGAAFDERLHQARKAMDQYGGDDLREWIERSGFGNHPGVIRMFAKVAQAVAEPGALKGGGGGQGPGAGNLSPSEAKARHQELTADREFMNKYYAGDRQAREEMRRLFDMMAPSSP
jgi:hypothetical protein